MRQLTEQQAIELHDSGIWKEWSADEKTKFQLFQDRLSMPFSVFHEAITKVLGRSVYTHEFAFRDSLIKEYLGEKEAPTFEEIISLIPSEKLIIIS